MLSFFQSPFCLRSGETLFRPLFDPHHKYFRYVQRVAGPAVCQPFRTRTFPIFPMKAEMLGSTFSVGARSGARDRRSRASYWDKPYWSPAPADSGSRSTRASPHWGSKRLPNTVLAWSRTKGTSYPPPEGARNGRQRRQEGQGEKSKAEKQETEGQIEKATG